MEWKALWFVCLLGVSLAYDPSLRRSAVIVDEESEHEVETNEWAIELMPNVDPETVAQRFGFEYVGPAFGLEDIHMFREKEETSPGETHPHILQTRSMEVNWAERQIARKRAKRDYIDPLFSIQWHLHPTALGNVHVNVSSAWAQNITGEGINIAIVDDGLEYTHPDLEENYRADLSYDFNYNDNNPFPDSPRDDHGTSAAGVAGARDNRACGLGSAYRAGLSGIRLISKSSTDIQEGAALKYRNDENHIFSNSWGPVDDGKRKEGPGRLAFSAMNQSIAEGRNGKGTLYVWAGGNGRRSGDNCNYDGWANSRWTMTIAAVDFKGRQAWYSESCSMLLVSAPSSGNGQSITTTDLRGLRGTSKIDCTSTFGGTSAAAPLAAGVVALVLQANPELSWRDMQGVLLESARLVDESDSGWKTNGGGLKYNHKYGFGLINAGGAVELAKNWNLLGEQKETSNTTKTSVSITSRTEIDLEIPDNITIEHVELYFIATHKKRGDIQISLVSPSGMESVLTERHGDRNKDYNWRFGSIAHWGESSKGTWQLRLKDLYAASNKGNVNEVRLVIYGHDKK